jgi:hypothetical protein
MLMKFFSFWTLSIILFIFKAHNFSETGFSLHLQVEPIQLGPINRTRPSRLNSGVLALSIFRLKGERESSLRNVVFLNRSQDDG